MYPHFTKKRTALQKTALNLEGKHSAKAVEEAQTKLAEAFKNLAAVNVEQYVKDKKFLKASDDLLRSKVAALQIATQKQMAVANSTSGAFDTASQLNTDPAFNVNAIWQVSNSKCRKKRSRIRIRGPCNQSR